MCFKSSWICRLAVCFILTEYIAIIRDVQLGTTRSSSFLKQRKASL